MAWRRALRSMPLFLLLAFAPSHGWGNSEPAPSIDLQHIAISGNEASAPTREGNRARLTLEPDLHRAALRLLAAAEPLSGAAVMLDVRTGKVLAWAELAHDRRRSVITSARVPAASVFKVVTTAALFEHTELDPNQEICIRGGVRGIERTHLESSQSAEATCGPFSQALGHSRNAVFAQLATKFLLRDDLVSTAESLGFNAQVPFDLPATMGSLVVPYNDLEFARTAAGFQGSLLSPLGGAYLASIIARGGEAIRFRILDPEDTGDAQSTESIGRVLSVRTARRITRMMEVTVQSGTSRAAFTDEDGRRYLKELRVAGKTGTLQPRDRRGTMTSWFIGFAPSRKPQVVISVMLQNGPVWRRKANQVGRDLLRAYFRSRGRLDISDPFETSAHRENLASRENF